MSEKNGHQQPTVVLAHGAFGDAASWNDVIERLQARGFHVVAPPSSLRSISHDAAYIASYFNQIPGPVLTVGHSDGGAVITNAASRATNVLGLVIVAGIAPEEGESLLQIEQARRCRPAISFPKSCHWRPRTPWRNSLPGNRNCSDHDRCATGSEPQLGLG